MSDRLIEKYVWVTDGGCPACEALDGEEFETIDDIPDKPHPNCDYTIREVDGELCDCVELLDDIEEMIGDAQSLQAEVEAEKSEIEAIIAEYADWDSMDVIRAVRDLHSLLSPLQTLALSIGYFADGWFKTKDLTGTGIEEGDKYYHAKANCQAAQLGITGSAVAAGLSELKEFLDFF